MTGNEVVRRLKTEQKAGHFFIKWWRKESDFVDFALIEKFIGDVQPNEIIDGFELLDMERMWNVLISMDPDNLARVKKNGEEVIHWAWVNREGQEQASVFPFTPEGIMQLFDDEFFS